MRVVLDTNVLISALFWDGNERRILWDCRKKKHQLIMSPDILGEMDRVLESKFRFPPEKRKEYARDIVLMSEMTFPRGSIDIIKGHPADNRVIETAVLGKAERLITGDKHLLDLKTYKGVKIEKAAKV